MKRQHRLAGLLIAAIIAVLFVGSAAFAAASVGSQSGSAALKNAGAQSEFAASPLPCVKNQDCAMPKIQVRRPGGCPKPRRCPMPKIEGMHIGPYPASLFHQTGPLST